MTFYNELQSRQTEIQAIAQKHGAINIRLFGSVARQEDNAGSDIDILAEFEQGRSLFDLIGLKQDLEKLLDHSVDILTPDSLHYLIRDQILSESITLAGTVR